MSPLLGGSSNIGAAAHSLLRDIVVDSGRDVELRLGDGTCRQLPGVQVDVGEALRVLAQAQGGGRAASQSDTSAVMDSDGAGGDEELKYFQRLREQQQQQLFPQQPWFTSDNRLALPGSLHRWGKGTWCCQGAEVLRVAWSSVLRC